MLIINCKSALTITDSDLCFLFCPSTFYLLFIYSCITASVFCVILVLLILSSQSLIILFSVYQLILSKINVVLTVFPSISLAALLTIASLGQFSHHFFSSAYFYPIQLLHKIFPLVFCSFLPVQLRGYFVAHWTVYQAIVLLCQFFLTN